ncbi:MAG: DUF4340 domain-containing protein, partial [Cyanobacteria bacterium J06559_3]
ALVITALLLGGVVLFIEAREANQTILSEDEAASPVYDFEETDVVSLSVETQTLAVTFERDDAGAWQLVDPEDHPAEEAAIAFLLSRLTTNGLVNTTSIDAAAQSEFGLDNPAATIKITLIDGTTHTVILGDADFTGENVYALVDPATFPLPEDAGEVAAAVLSPDIVNGVDRPLAEWKAVVESPTDSDTDEEPGADAEATDADEPGPEDNQPDTEATDEATDTDEPTTEDSPETDTTGEAATPEAEADTSGETIETPEADERPTETAPETADTETESAPSPEPDALESQ